MPYWIVYLSSGAELHVADRPEVAPALHTAVTSVARPIVLPVIRSGDGTIRNGTFRSTDIIGHLPPA